jgi:hypothetical protein
VGRDGHNPCMHDEQAPTCSVPEPPARWPQPQFRDDSTKRIVSYATAVRRAEYVERMRHLARPVPATPVVYVSGGPQQVPKFIGVVRASIPRSTRLACFDGTFTRQTYKHEWPAFVDTLSGLVVVGFEEKDCTGNCRLSRVRAVARQEFHNVHERGKPVALLSRTGLVPLVDCDVRRVGLVQRPELTVRVPPA